MTSACLWSTDLAGCVALRMEIGELVLDSAGKPSMRGALAKGELIRQIRIDSGETQEKLAAAASIDVKTVRKAEQGQRVDLNTLNELARVLGVRLPALMAEPKAAIDIQQLRVRAVESWISAWNRHDLDALMMLYHNDAVMSLPGGAGVPSGGRFEGKAAIRRVQEQAWQTSAPFPLNWRDTILTTISDMIVLLNTRSIQLPDGDEGFVSTARIYRFVDHLIIVELRFDYGLVPRPATD